MATDPSFEVVVTSDAEPGETLLVGLADVGVAGLSAANYLVNQVETTEIGHVRSHNVPDVTPVADGRPRHPIRLYGCERSDVSVLISEVFLPVAAAEPFADALLEWVDAAGFSEVVAVEGTLVRHTEDEHVVLRAGTEPFHERHFTGGAEPGIEGAVDVRPLAGGFFDGVIAELLSRSLEGRAPPVGALVTPAHPPGPDLDGALRLLETVQAVWGLAVDEAALREEAAQMKRHFEELSERMRTLQEETVHREYPEDRMYM